MIDGKLDHQQFNIDAQNLNFYKEFFDFLGWPVLYEGDIVIGFGQEEGPSLWFDLVKDKEVSDYDNIGHNHLGFTTASVENVDKTVAFIQKRGIPALFGTPRHRPEFCEAGTTYYQVIFETPDRFQIEVLYRGPWEE